MLSLTKLTDDLIEDEEIDVAKHASNSMMMMEMLQKLESSLTVLKPSSELLPVSELHNFFQSAGVGVAFTWKFNLCERLCHKNSFVL